MFLEIDVTPELKIMAKGFSKIFKSCLQRILFLVKLMAFSVCIFTKKLTPLQVSFKKFTYWLLPKQPSKFLWIQKDHQQVHAKHKRVVIIFGIVMIFAILYLIKAQLVKAY